MRQTEKCSPHPYHPEMVSLAHIFCHTNKFCAATINWLVNYSISSHYFLYGFFLWQTTEYLWVLEILIKVFFFFFFTIFRYFTDQITNCLIKKMINRFMLKCNENIGHSPSTGHKELRSCFHTWLVWCGLNKTTENPISWCELVKILNLFQFYLWTARVGDELSLWQIYIFQRPKALFTPKVQHEKRTRKTFF